MSAMRRLKTLVTAVLTATLLGLPALAYPFSDTDVPFIITPDNVTLEMLKLANVGPKDYVLDLGSGDGRIVILAAKRFGARGLGVEIVPDLVRQSNANARAAGVADRAEFREQDLFKTDLSAASAITMYLLPEVNLQLRPALLALKPGTRLVSHDWDMGDWQPDQTITVAAPDKPIGREKSSRLHRWVVSAQVAGLWCGAAGLRSFSIELAQKFQNFEGTLRRQVGGQTQARELAGRINGAVLQASSGAVSGGAALLTFELQGDALHVTGADSSLSALRGMSLRRDADGRCS
jgi:SAM-dependent methyltransferase